MKARNLPISSLSVVLPAFNEGAIIEQVIKQVLQHLSPCDFPFEIIVVNDGSTDRTKEIIEKLKAQHHTIKLVNHEYNKGYGEALRSGFRMTTMEWIFQMDSDGQFDIRDLDTFSPYTINYDVLLGYRSNRADPPSRIAWTLVLNTLSNVCSGLGLKDVSCGFKLLRRTSWIAAQPVRSQAEKIFVVELIWNIKKANLLIKELPVSHYPRLSGVATGGSLAIAWRTFKALTELYFR